MKRSINVFKYVMQLRAKHGKAHYRVPFPDLKTPPSPCTNGFGPTPKRKANPQTSQFVDCLHKQGMMVLSKDELPWAGGKKP